MTAITLLDGPLGTELERAGAALPAPAWTAVPLAERPDAVLAVHRAWADAGADVHTTATFRTRRRSLRGTPWEDRWEELARRAVALCREGAGTGRVAGSVAPLEDCFEPERTPGDDALRAEHEELVAVLADAGCDLLLVETMPTRRELRAAVRAAAATGLPVWAAVTPGPRDDFFDAAALAEARSIAADEGAEAFLLNCASPAVLTRRLRGLGPPPAGLRSGGYANDLFGEAPQWPPERFAAELAGWRAFGATILGGCCGTRPAHLRALRHALAA